MLPTMAKVRNARPRLIAHALSLPDAWEDHPWNETVAKVGKKIFVFFGRDEADALFVGVKLSRSLAFARTRPFVQRFGYGLDASGWAAARFGKGDDVPLDLLLEWIDESYAAIAPKKPGAKRAAAAPAVARTPPRRASK